MDRKEQFTRTLDKILIRADYLVTEESRYNLFITRSQYILEKLNRKKELTAFNNLVEVYDVKNDLFYTINLDDVFSVEHIGLPFEVYPEYLYKPQLDGKIALSEFYEYQKVAIDFAIELGNRMSKKEFENNKLLVSTIEQCSIINNIDYIIKNNLDNFKYTFDENDRERFKKFNLAYLEPNLITLQEELIQKTFKELESEFSNIFEYIKYVKVCEFAQLPLRLLDSTDEQIVEKVKQQWKLLIEEKAKKIVTEIACESETLDDIEKSEDKEEMDYVKNLIINSISEIDYSVFKTPRQIFHFWPSVIFPIPGFVVHD